MSLGYRAYAAVTAVLAPLVIWADRRRFLRKGGPPDRTGERCARDGAARPPGRVIWINAVSVGEVRSVLALAERLGQSATIVLTTTSATSAETVAQAALPGVIHQFAPLDLPGPVRRFLDHWRPDLAVFVESDLWPRQIVDTDARDIPLALVNARLSVRSLRRWAMAPTLARALFERFGLILAQDRRTADGLAQFGVEAKVAGTLKTAAPRLPADADERARLAAIFGDRPVWVAASTHPGEEEIVLAARPPGALTILVPRHRERGDTVRALAEPAGPTAQRSRGEMPGPETETYVADTLGELGLWFSLARAVVMGGSFADHGGHNPLEPAQFGVPVLSGPHVTNFADIYAELEASGHARRVEADALKEALSQAMTAPRPAPYRPDDSALKTVMEELQVLGRDGSEQDRPHSNDDHPRIPPE